MAAHRSANCPRDVQLGSMGRVVVTRQIVRTGRRLCWWRWRRRGLLGGGGGVSDCQHWRLIPQRRRAWNACYVLGSLCWNVQSWAKASIYLLAALEYLEINTYFGPRLYNYMHSYHLRPAFTLRCQWILRRMILKPRRARIKPSQSKQCTV